MARVLLIPSLLLIVLGIACYLASAGALRTTGPNRPIVICYADDVKTLDVGEMSWQNDIRTAMALWEGLTSYDPATLAPIPGVAESWDISPDQKTYTFHLRPNARWSNGDPVTAQDFIFAWKRVFVPATGANYLTLFNVIDGAQEYGEAIADNKPADFSTVAVRSPDPHTLIVRLKHPRGYFLDLCAFPTFFPLHEAAMQPFLVDPSDAAKGYNGRWMRPPTLVTNGAFYLNDWKFKQYMLLEPNPHYWDRANVHCDQLIIRAISDPRAALLAFRSGTVDVLTNIPPQFGKDLLAQPEDQRRDIHYQPVFGTYYYLFNCTRGPLKDARVRKALALSIDRKKIVDEVTRMHQRPITVLVPPDSIPGYKSPAGLEMNIDEAKRLLADAGYPEGKGMPTLEILYNNEAMHERISQALGQMWEQALGIHVTYRGLERGSFGSERQEAHNFDIARAGWYGDYGDPTTWLNLFATGDNNNDGLYSNAAYDKLLAEANAEPDAQRRLNILSDAERLLVEDQFPLLPLYQYADGYMYDDAKIGGFTMNVRELNELKWIYRK
jgi:oligopeptide transport system substrate-binding protein